MLCLLHIHLIKIDAVCTTPASLIQHAVSRLLSIS